MSISPERPVDAVPEPPMGLPLPSRSALPLAFLLLVAGGIMLGGLIRQHFGHPVMDVVGLQLILVAAGAAVPPWRYAIGEIMVGSAVVLLVLPLSLDLSVSLTFELVVGAVLLGGVGALYMERYPPHPLHPADEGYWRTVSLTALLLDLLVRRNRR